MIDPYDIIYHPFVTEKTMNFMEKNNALEFVVKRDANKKIIKPTCNRLKSGQSQSIAPASPAKALPISTPST